MSAETRPPSGTTPRAGTPKTGGFTRARRAERAATEVLRHVPILAGLPGDAIDTLAHGCEVRTFPEGAQLVAELEPGEEAYVLLEGAAKVTVGGWSDEPPVELNTIGAGDCVGEMSLFTGELRSATITATGGPVRALVIDRERFLALLQRHPSIGAHLAGVIATRLRETEQVLSTILDPHRSDSERREALRRHSKAHATKRFFTALSVAWREMVASHLRELPFLMFLSFVGALATDRAAIHLARVSEAAHLEELLRTTYLLGIVLLGISGMTSLLSFRPRARRVLACLFGAGMALLFNALPVLLSFDLFYSDIFTPDPKLHFSIEVLYERSEGAYVLVLAGAVLMQAVYLRRFYRRLLTLVSLRLTRGRRVA